MRVAVLRETDPGERRVAVVPDAVARLAAAGWTVVVESGAGATAYVTDASLKDRGAEISADRRALLAGSDAVLSVQPLPPADATSLRPGTVCMSFLQPWAHADAIDALTRASATAFSLDLVPRISRAQPMDALSS